MKHYKRIIPAAEVGELRQKFAECSHYIFMPTASDFKRVGNGKYSTRATFYTRNAGQLTEQFRIYY